MEFQEMSWKENGENQPNYLPDEIPEALDSGHRLEDEAFDRLARVKEELVWLGLDEVQYSTACSHPIFFAVLRIALNDHISFWEAQYKWLGENPDIQKTGNKVKIEFHRNNFREQRELWKMMWNE